VRRRLGDGRLDEALREVLVASYDMTGRSPFFFKRWRARADPARNSTVLDAALSTAAAPTYFPPRELDGHALVDGGVFAANPVIAAISEALKRTESPGGLEIDDLLVLSIGTGLHEEGFPPREVRGWGRLGWILPRRGEPPILGAVLDGASDGADHWAHMLLNHVTGEGAPSPSEIGRGPRYFRLQVPLSESIGLDDASEEALRRRLPDAAAELISENEPELEQIVERLLAAGPLPPDPAS
jgi:patatin-like phospholipase/acyl hydrolase